MSLRNNLYMQSTCLTNPQPPVHRPKVSVLLAARNEEHNIERCLNSLLRQNYDNYEILVMNDDSTDDTSAVLAKMAAAHAQRDRLRVFTSHHLPSDWYGKAYSVQQLAQHATGDVFMVTDADTVHEPNSLAFGVTCLFDYDCDFISGKLLFRRISSDRF
jgi:chlorobactene glucosyltransferase